MPLRICVYSIALNEVGFVNRFCESAADADLVLVADTGSTDETRTLAREFGVAVHSINISPWRFDDARNAVLALVPPDYDVCVSLDLDEVLQPGWRKEIERVWVEGETTRLSYLFDWANNGNAFRYDKIHARKGYRWIHPCHEVVRPYGIDEVWASTDKTLVIHQPDPTKSRSQYLGLLEMSIKEDPNNPRNAFYYARELSFNGRWQDAIDECQRYLALKGADWANERCYAYRVMSRAYDALGDKHEALRAARLGVTEAPNTREPWVEVALIAYTMGRWEECYGAAMSALRITERELVYTVDPEVWGAKPHDLAAISAYHLGFRDAAIEQGRLATIHEPNNGRYLANLNWYEDMPH